MERKTSQFKHVEEHTTPEVEFSWLPSGTEWCECEWCCKSTGYTEHPTHCPNGKAERVRHVNNCSCYECYTAR